MPTTSRSSTTTEVRQMPFAAHPGRLLKRELEMRGLSANRLALDLGVPSGRITDILNGRRSITADTALRLGCYFGNRAQFCSIFRANTISRLPNGTTASKSPVASSPPMLPSRERCVAAHHNYSAAIAAAELYAYVSQVGR